jgi:hypothetical protein
VSADPCRLPKHPRHCKRNGGDYVCASCMGTPDILSEWTLPPPAARASGCVEPIRVFDSAEEALRFLAAQDRHAPRVLAAESGERLP